MTYSRPQPTGFDITRPARQTGELGGGGNVDPTVSASGRFIDNRSTEVAALNAKNRNDIGQFFSNVLDVGLGLGQGGDGKGIIFDIVDGKARNDFGNFAASGGLDKLRPGSPEEAATLQWVSNQNPLLKDRILSAQAGGQATEYLENLNTEMLADARLSDPTLGIEQRTSIEAEIKDKVRSRTIASVNGKYLAPYVPKLSEGESTIYSKVFSRTRENENANARAQENRSSAIILSSIAAENVAAVRAGKTYDVGAALTVALPRLVETTSASSTVDRVQALSTLITSVARQGLTSGETEQTKALLDGLIAISEGDGVKINGQNVFRLALDNAGTTFADRVKALRYDLNGEIKNQELQNYQNSVFPQIQALAAKKDYDALSQLLLTADSPDRLRILRSVIDPILGDLKQATSEADNTKIADVARDVNSGKITKEAGIKKILTDLSMSGQARITGQRTIEGMNESDPMVRNFAGSDQAQRRNQVAADTQTRLLISKLAINGTLPPVGGIDEASRKAATTARDQQISDRLQYDANRLTSQQAEKAQKNGVTWGAKEFDEAYLKNLGIAADKRLKERVTEAAVEEKDVTRVTADVDYLRRAFSQGLTGIMLYSPALRVEAQKQNKLNPTGLQDLLRAKMAGAVVTKGGQATPMFAGSDGRTPDMKRINKVIDDAKREGIEARRQSPNQPTGTGGPNSNRVGQPARGRDVSWATLEATKTLTLDVPASQVPVGGGYVATENTRGLKGMAFGGRTQTLYGIKEGTGYDKNHEDHVHHASVDKMEALEVAKFMKAKGWPITEFQGWKQHVGGHTDKSDHYNGTAFDIPVGKERHKEVLRDLNEFYANRRGGSQNIASTMPTGMGGSMLPGGAVINPGSTAQIAQRYLQAIQRYAQPLTGALSEFGNALFRTQPGGGLRGNQVPAGLNMNPAGLSALQGLRNGGKIDASTPPLPQAAASSRVGTLPNNIGANHSYYVAIGIAEGTRTPNGGFTQAYYGHQDPSGRSGVNRGTVSNNEGKTPAQVDRDWTAILTRQLRQASAVVAQYVPPDSVGYHRLMFNILDLRVQAPGAVQDFIRAIPKMIQKGLSVEAIARERANSFRDPADGQWKFDRQAFGNYSGLLADQRRRAMAWEYKRSF